MGEEWSRRKPSLVSLGRHRRSADPGRVVGRVVEREWFSSGLAIDIFSLQELLSEVL
jgi:hypothetical protein